MKGMGGGGGGGGKCLFIKVFRKLKGLKVIEEP